MEPVSKPWRPFSPPHVHVLAVLGCEGPQRHVHDGAARPVVEVLVLAQSQDDEVVLRDMRRAVALVGGAGGVLGRPQASLQASDAVAPVRTWPRSSRTRATQSPPSCSRPPLSVPASRYDLGDGARRCLGVGPVRVGALLGALGGIEQLAGRSHAYRPWRGSPCRRRSSLRQPSQRMQHPKLLKSSLPRPVTGGHSQSALSLRSS